VERAISLAGGASILADGIAAEQVALAGGRVWMSNPIDAFSRDDQRLYLDWLDGRPNGDGALDHASRVVLVDSGSDAHERLARNPSFRPAARDEGAVLYVRR
jgi:hypothetical protein